MATGLDWILIYKFGKDPIGAVGFLGDDVAVIAAFYDDRDGDKDGKVGLGERIAGFVSPISLEGRAVAEVAMQAQYTTDVMLRSADIRTIANTLFLNFARTAVADGIYAVYFRPGVKMMGKGAAKMITGSAIKQIMVRKGFEAAAKKAFEAGVAP